MRTTAPVHFTPVRVAEQARSIAARVGAWTIEIELSGVRLRITGAADTGGLKGVLAALAGGRRRWSRSPPACGCGSRRATPTCVAHPMGLPDMGDSFPLGRGRHHFFPNKSFNAALSSTAHIVRDPRRTFPPCADSPDSYTRPILAARQLLRDTLLAFEKRDMIDQLRRTILVGGMTIALAGYQTSAFPQPSQPLPQEAGDLNSRTAETLFVRFSDLTSSSEAESAINNMVAQGIMRGVTPTQFAPETPLSQGDFVIAMQRMFKLPRASRSVDFSDVAPNSPIYAALQALEPYLGRQILCFGCALGTNFLPNQAISSAEMIFIMTRILTGQNKLQLLNSADAYSVLAGRSDTSQLSPPSRVYFATAIRNGILIGAENRIALPSEVTRADAALFLDRIQRKFDIPRVQPPP
jgi:hypothetical protein